MASCYFLSIRDKVCMLINKGIIPEVKLVSEAKPKDTNDKVVLFPLSTKRCLVLNQMYVGC